MKLILILTFFCAIQWSLHSSAADQNDSQTRMKPKAQKSTLIKSSKMTTQPPASRCINDPQNPSLKCGERTPVQRSQKEIISQKNKPKLKANEYSLSFEKNRTTVFATKLHEGLLLSQNCFKKKSPTCKAYTKSIQSTNTKPAENMKSPYHNNFGAIHCELMGGKGLIAKSSTNDESDFCQFEDGSMVSSWSAYYKTHPPGIQTK